MAKNKTGRTGKTDMPEKSEVGYTSTPDTETSMPENAPPADEEPKDEEPKDEEPGGGKTGSDKTHSAPGPDAPLSDSEPPVPPQTAHEDRTQPPDESPGDAPPSESVENEPDPELRPETGRGDADSAPETEPVQPEAEGVAPPADVQEPAAVVRTEQVTVRKGGFWSMLLGGIAAAGIGVAAAPYIVPNFLPPMGQTDQGALEERLAEQVDRIAGLEEQVDRIAGLEQQISNLPSPVDQSDEIDGLSQTVTSLAGRLADLEQQFAELAARPAPEPAADGAFDEALAALRERLDAQRTEIDALSSEAELNEQAARESARATLRRAALLRVMTALDSGEEFSGALAELRDTGVDVPQALVAVAETGAPTHAALTGGFPDAARAALAAARQENDERASSVRDFLRGQLGMRSLEPREGNDPDAVLSRAEAALADGRLGDSLAEIEALPEGARAAMSGWAANAALRRDTIAAAEALSAAMN